MLDKAERDALVPIVMGAARSVLNDTGDTLFDLGSSSRWIISSVNNKSGKNTDRDSRLLVDYISSIDERGALIRELSSAVRSYRDLLDFLLNHQRSVSGSEAASIIAAHARYGSHCPSHFTYETSCANVLDADPRALREVAEMLAPGSGSLLLSLIEQCPAARLSDVVTLHLSLISM
jgi:hypothetical protein